MAWIADRVSEGKFLWERIPLSKKRLIEFIQGGLYYEGRGMEND